MVKKEKDQSTREKILAAAQEIFFQQGFAGARMQDIANAAGINKALLHYYFTSKEMLFQVIFAEAFGKLIPRIFSIIESEAPLLDKIDMFVEQYITVLSEHPFIPMFVLNEMNKSPDAFFQRYMAGQALPPVNKLVAEIQTAVQKGIIRPIHPAQLLLNILSLCIFPFVARPLFTLAMNITRAQFDQLISERRQSVQQFIRQAIEA